MNEKQFEDDGVEYINSYNYTLLDTHYESDGKKIIEWNKYSSNAEYTDFERIVEILNIKQMRLESIMKYCEEVGKLLDKIDKQQSTIQFLKEELKLEQDFALRWQKESEMLAEENKELKHWKKRIIEYLTDWFNKTEYLSVLNKIAEINNEIGLDSDE